MPEKPTQYIANTADLTAVADAIRTKGGTTDTLIFPDGFVSAIGNLGSGEPVQPKDVNFIDYDGTVLYAYSVAEAAALTALPALPTHEGLTCQGWNWTLADIKALGRAVTVGAMYITDDGKTRIYIHLEEGRTSPMLGCCPNGTVTVDWGDGTTADTLTGTSTSEVQWTPTHNYAAPGGYVIKLAVSGEMGFYRYGGGSSHSALLSYSSESDTRNVVYCESIKKIEIGNGVTFIGERAFPNLDSITIPNSVTSISSEGFRFCQVCSITIPNSVTEIKTAAFMNNAFLSSISIPNGVTSMNTTLLFYGCSGLRSVWIPAGTQAISFKMFADCGALSSVSLPNTVTSIASNAFVSCYGIKFYDFTAATAVPTLASTDAFSDIADDCEIRVPASLVDTWKAATNWSQYAKYIVGVAA